MADFVPTTVNKTAFRDLAVPIADVTSFNTLVQAVIDDNPFACVGYTTKTGQTVPAVVRNREHYTLMSELPRRRGQTGRDRLAPVPLDRRVQCERRGSPRQHPPRGRDGRRGRAEQRPAQVPRPVR